VIIVRVSPVMSLGALRATRFVRYAFEAASGAGHLTLGDEVILHALGVEWSEKAFEGQRNSPAVGTLLWHSLCGSTTGKIDSN
jgi:hypothetical protein